MNSRHLFAISFAVALAGTFDSKLQLLPKLTSEFAANKCASRADSWGECASRPGRVRAGGARRDHDPAPAHEHNQLADSATRPGAILRNHLPYYGR